MCLSMIAHLFKRHRQQRPTQEYSIPEATRHSNLPHDNETKLYSEALMYFRKNKMHLPR
ncbi:unnamed protein product [Wuchereria bancrofti]|uniref:Uncharacterized protein n=1 Tax=Wuchereria bancrofti TaxID=6293 RepID=A0A3P7DWP4_WUCBA|nr:unnamed protein product [Wuchereria bancrofti]